jgi:hypothetical protein
MSKVKLVVALLVAATALSAMTASSALAAGEWFVNKVKLTGTAPLANTAPVDTSTVLNAPSLGIKVTCSGSLLEAKKPFIKAPNSGGAESLTFTGCSEIAPITCTIQEKVETEPVVATLETSASPVASATIIRFAPETGKRFAVLVFKGTCAEAGEQPVDGSVAAGSQNGQVEQTTHPLEGLGSADNNVSLELFKGKAYLEGGKALLKLASGETWSFHS